MYLTLSYLRLKSRLLIGLESLGNLNILHIIEYCHFLNEYSPLNIFPYSMVRFELQTFMLRVGFEQPTSHILSQHSTTLLCGTTPVVTLNLRVYQ